MKLSMLSTALLTSVLALAGCAGMEHRSTYATEQRVSSGSVQDAAYVARVEAAARARGVQVLWISPPVIKSNSSEDPQ